MVFYRKFRPQKFTDLIGQDHVTKTLSNALSAGTFSHGYLFAGPRGSGKTTLARIFAKALNCTGRKLGKDSFEPCNKCISCQEITAGKSLDLIEIDAASNRGIDEIRDLREKIRFAPTKSNYKIYIIDEVHMLTKEAFNALLKTLEEPPKHAIFIMATTEPQKILPTILSRVQRFDFRRAELSELKKLLKKIANLEEIKIDDEGIELLAQLAFGSYRDSLSLFGQIASLRKTSASNITIEQIQQVLGLAQDKSVFDFVKFLATKDRQKAFELVAHLHLQGVDLETFTIKLVEILRKIALLKLGENQLFDLTKDQQEEVQNLSKLFEIETLMEMVEKFAAAANQIKSAHLPQLPLELLIYEFTKKSEEVRDKKLETPENKIKINKLHIKEEYKEGRVVASSEMPVEEHSDLPKLGDEAKPEATSRLVREAENEKQSETNKSTVKLDKNLWPQIVKEVKIHNCSLSALLKDAELAGAEDSTIILSFKFKFHANMISNKKNTQIIEGIIERITGSHYKLDCVVNPDLVVSTPVDAEEELLSGAKEVFEVEE